MVLSEKQYIAGEINRLIYFGTPLTKPEIMDMYQIDEQTYTEIMKIALQK